MVQKRATEAEAVSRLKDIIQKAKLKGMTEAEIVDCIKANGYAPKDASKKSDNIGEEFNPYQQSCTLLNCLIFKVYPIFFGVSLLLYPAAMLVTGSACLITEISPLGEAVNPIIDCGMCEGLTEAPRLTNLSMDDFIRDYAYTSRPILVVGAVSHWSALSVFSYEYFKSVYMDSPESLEEDNDSGQFFAYSSNIRDLKGLFSLPSDVDTEKWYIGWSTSDPRISETLKEHISVPPFIPPTLTDLSKSWIFMGSPGPGANIHIDMVRLPSWQAQLRGRKTWSLIPPPECEHKCHAFNVTMDTGDVIVVDTNKWYHQTYIHPGSISITIGSEYGNSSTPINRREVGEGVYKPGYPQAMT